jgi:hypothetical protein
VASRGRTCSIALASPPRAAARMPVQHDPTGVRAGRWRRSARNESKARTLHWCDLAERRNTRRASLANAVLVGAATAPIARHGIRCHESIRVCPCTVLRESRAGASARDGVHPDGFELDARSRSFGSERVDAPRSQPCRPRGCSDAVICPSCTTSGAVRGAADGRVARGCETLPVGPYIRRLGRNAPFHEDLRLRG